MSPQDQARARHWLALFCGFLVFLYLIFFGIELRARPLFFWIANW